MLKIDHYRVGTMTKDGDDTPSLVMLEVVAEGESERLYIEMTPAEAVLLARDVLDESLKCLPDREIE
jgi:hypothetical protein